MSPEKARPVRGSTVRILTFRIETLREKIKDAEDELEVASSALNAALEVEKRLAGKTKEG